MKLELQEDDYGDGVKFAEVNGETILKLRDLSCVREEDIGNIDLKGSSNSIFKQYEDLKDWVKSISTRGGTVIGGKDCLMQDTVNPVMVLIVKDECEGKDVTTAFLIRKEDLYVVGYNLMESYEAWKNPENWILTKDGLTWIDGAKYATWGGSYQWLIKGEMNRNDKRKVEKLGRDSINTSLAILHSNSSDYAKCMALHSIARNFSEGFRCIRVEMVIRKAIREHQDKPLSEDKLGKGKGYNLEDYFNNWSAMSKMLVALSVQGYLKESQYRKLKSLGIDTTDQLKGLVSIVKRENPRTREKRRVGDQRNFGTFDYFAKDIVIEIMPPTWDELKLVDNLERQTRMQELYDKWYEDEEESERQLRVMRENELYRLEKQGRKAFLELEKGRKIYFKSIVLDTDVILMSGNLNSWRDDEGNYYELDELFLSRPRLRAQYA